MKRKAALYVTLFSTLLFLVACGGSTSSGGGSASTVMGAKPISAHAQQGVAPTITGFSPAWQEVGSAITISGADFDTTAANNSVQFSNNVPATVASATATSLVVIVPAGTINGGITVATAGGSVTSSTSFVVKNSAPPTITASPTSGAVGATVTISGTNFDASAQNNLVTFNGTPATVSLATTTSLTVIVPSATNGNITVTSPGGTAISANTFSITPTVVSTPTITSFTPLRGVVGIDVTISGNFDPTAGNNAVSFFGTPATLKTATATSLTVTVPTGVATGPISVTTAGKTAKTSTNFTLTGTPVAGLMGGAKQGALSLLGTALTFAGGGVVNSAANGTGATARFNNPNGITSDGINSILYVADSGNRVIRKIDMSVSGVVSVTTIAGSGLAGSADGTGIGAGFSTPNGITTDGTSLFVADSGNNRIRKITPLTGTLSTMNSGNAQVTTLAGSGSMIFKDHATGTSAGIRSPYGIATDNTNLYVTDGSNRIRKINIATSTVTTLAGSGAYKSKDGTGTSYADGITPSTGTIASTGTIYSTGTATGTTNPAPETVASFYRPRGIVISPDKSTLYVADSGTNVIRKVVIATAAVTSLMGPGFTYVTSLSPGAFQNPNGMSVSGTGTGATLYVADVGNNRILQVDLTAAQNYVANLAGAKGSVGSTNDVGLLASFHFPNGLALLGSSIYVTDSGNNLIRQIDISTKTVTTLAGNIVVPSDVNGIGTSSKFNFPFGITSDGTNLYIADSGAREIRKIVIASGVVTTLVGSVPFGAVDARGGASSFNYPFGITTDGTNIYVADTGNNTIRQIVISSGDVTTLAGAGVLGSVDGVGIAASFNQPAGITTDGNNLYVSDSGNHRIRQIVISTGVVSTLAGSGVIGSSDATGTAASFKNPIGITTDGTNLYIADSGNNKIRQVVIATGVVSTLAGTGSYWYDDIYNTLTTTWLGNKANFRSPTGITTDGTSLYVTDADNNEIRKITPQTGISLSAMTSANAQVTTLSGSGAFAALDTTPSAWTNAVTVSPVSDGTGTEANFSHPVGITTDGTSLYTTEYLNNLIRKIQ